MVFVLVHPCRSTTAQGECGQEQPQELEERMVFVAIILKRRRSNTPHCNRESVRAGSGSSCFGSSVTTCHGRVAAWPDFETIAVKRGPSGSCWIGSGERPAPVILRACLAVRVRVFRHPGTDPRTRQLLRCPRSRRVDDRRDGSNLAPGPSPEEARTGGGGPLVGPARGACTSTVQP